MGERDRERERGRGRGVGEREREIWMNECMWCVVFKYVFTNN